MKNLLVHERALWFMGEGLVHQHIYFRLTTHPAGPLSIDARTDVFL